MEKITAESIISSLLLVGFDKIDIILYTCILEKLSRDNKEMKMFEFIEESSSDIFNDYINYDGVIFSLKDGITMETNISITSNKFIHLKNLLYINKELIKYFEGLDYIDVVLRKKMIIDNTRLTNIDYLFSDKEKEILFGMENNNKKRILNNY